MDKHDHITPPDPMTEPCSRFFRAHLQLFELIVFIGQLAVNADKASEKAAQLLFEIAEDEREKQRAKERLDHGGRAKKAFRSIKQPLLQMVLSRGVDNFLAYITELLTLIFRTKPETLRSRKVVRMDFVLRHSTMEDLVAALAENRVEQLSYQGMRTLSKDFDERLGLRLFEHYEALQRATRIVEQRNVIVHNRAIVNRLFLSRVSESRFKLGEQIKLDGDPFLDDMEFLARCVADIDTRAATKFGLPRPIPRERPKTNTEEAQ